MAIVGEPPAAPSPEAGAQPRTTVSVNGAPRSLRSATSLLSALRESGLTGAKPGCGEGACGSCTVLLDGEAVRACQQSVADLGDRRVTTIEALGSSARLHPVQQAFVDVGATQCGYCTPGMVLAVAALLARHPDPDDEQVGEALADNLCRCGCYPRIRRAVHRAVELTKASPVPHDPPSTPEPEDFAPLAPGSLGFRPERPWDMTDPMDRAFFELLGDGLVVVLPPPAPAPGGWPTRGGGAWVHLGDGGTVTAFTGKVDVGQDNRTALRLLVAEELRVPLSAVRLAMGDTDLCPYDMGTFGSRSMPDAGEALRRVAAHARSLSPAPSGSNRVEVMTSEPDVTPPSEWRVAGTAHRPRGTLGVVTGAQRFVSDLTFPGLWHGAVLCPPTFGATLSHLDTTGVEGRAGVVVVHTDKVLGVVAADPEDARRALADLRPTWNSPAAPSDSGLEAFLRSHPDERTQGWSGPLHHLEGDPDDALGRSAVRTAATYTTAYIAPCALEPRTALAVWDADGRLTVWTGTQTPFAVRAQLAVALDVPEHRVRVIVPPTGGGFGGKQGAGGGVAAQAALLAQQVGKPVRVAWSRHDEFIAGTLRPAAVIDVAAGATADGELAAWKFTNINSGPAAITTPYRVPHQQLDYQPAAGPLPQGSYRALAATANNFARESHIDEMAHALGIDPVEFRLRNLNDERLASVLRAAVERFGWDPRGTGHGHGDGVGHGVACGLEKGGRVATVAEVRIESGAPLRVVRLVTAYECGAVVNPDTVVNQIEGATVMALGGALFEAIHFVDGSITNGSFSAYRTPRMPDVPPIDVVLMDRPDLPSDGAGETPMIGVAPAIANAIFDASAQRLRSLPLLGGWSPVPPR
jgi:isoquinoline 1-oxidoreductase